MTNDLNARRDVIFDVIVRSYIETAEPVASRTLSRKHSIGLSPASIRNVMADLEEQGLLTHPHTSAGRIPTDKGYRYWVDALMRPEELSEKEKQWILSELAKARTIEDMAERLSKIISELTENPALIFIKNLKRVSFLNYLLEDLVKEVEKLNDFLEEEPEIFIQGAFRIFKQPEFQSLEKMRQLMLEFDEQAHLLQLLVKDLGEQGLHVHIGSESPLGDLDGVSLVVKDCYMGTLPVGGVAVVGPTRMKYAKAVSVVDFVADSVTRAMERY
ncbi:MAG: heat-inducible transcriptional repressor HrcA [Candidatus Omnitrophica bacterium]|nr:heat-inducible transcriptional repressor HrcA [Candidatus Omnitrophota bacterium]